MLYIYSIFLTIIAFIRRNSNIVYYMLMLLLILLMFGNTYNADMNLYIINYENILESSYKGEFEIGYQLLAKISANLGLSYRQFLLIISILGLGLISSTIKLFTHRISYVLGLYFIYPFIWDVVQIRNFLAMSIIIYGMRYLISENKNYYKYIVCVLIASTVHMSSLFYLFLVLVKINNIRKLSIGLIFTVIISIFFMPQILNILSNIVPQIKMQAYTQTETSILTKSLGIGYYIYLVILVKISVDIINKIDSKGSKSLRYTKKYTYGKFFIKKKTKDIDPESILKICIISSLALYFFINNLNFIRIYRNLYIIYYILFSVTLFKIDNSKLYYKYYILILGFVILTLVIFATVVQTTKIIPQVFENNIIL